MTNARQVSDRCRNVDGYSEVMVNVNGMLLSVSRIEEGPTGVPGRRQIVLFAAAMPTAEPAAAPEPEPVTEPEPEPEPEPAPKPARKGHR